MQRILQVLLFLPVVFGSCRAHKGSLSKDLTILTRSEWSAKAPVLPMKQHVPDRITIHHTATPQAPGKAIAEKLQALQGFSQSRSTLGSGRIKELWADIPYHYYIAANGEIGEGREIQYTGDSNTPYDPTGHALIVLEGNFQSEEVSPGQLESLQKLIAALSRKYGIGAERISAHKDHAETLCPGTKLYSLIPAFKQALDKVNEGR
jgi:hypothetical protein